MQGGAYRALDAAEGEADGGVPVLGRLLDEVVDGVADLNVRAGVRVCSCTRNRRG